MRLEESGVQLESAGDSKTKLGSFYRHFSGSMQAMILAKRNRYDNRCWWGQSG